ncbi:MAG: hypothetical protein SFV21_08480 [Rhodospirillaceae bacterium]|nr:hypothetical protein [Rhodospirillaceae bacterium]
MVGLPARGHVYLDAEDESTRYAIDNEPGYAEKFNIAVSEPWRLSIADIFSIQNDELSDFAVEGPAPTPADRMGRGQPLPAALVNTTEIAVYRLVGDRVTNDSIFLVQRDGIWAIAGWHSASTWFSAPANFNDALNPLMSRWSEACGMGYVDCMNSGFVFGLMPYDVYQAMKN